MTGLRGDEYVYFVRNQTSGLVKIGVSAWLARRITQMSTASGVALTLEAVIPGGGREAERALHRRFAHLAVGGEWFTPDSGLEDVIRESAARYGKYDASQWTRLLSMQERRGLQVGFYPVIAIDDFRAEIADLDGRLVVVEDHGVVIGVWRPAS